MALRWKRRVVPRWRASDERPVVFGSDTRQAPRPNFMQDSETLERFDRALADFAEFRSIGFAADAIRFATVDAFCERLVPVAKFLNSQEEALPEKVRSDIHRILGRGLNEANDTEAGAIDTSRRHEIHSLKQRLSLYPNNALAWIDLARLRTSSGDNEAARRDVLTSLGLQPENRLVMRSAARFFMHVGDPERAASLLSKSPRTASDPWLLASEISACAIAGRTSRFVKRATELLQSGRHSAADTSELAGALAAEHVSRGASRKQAKKLYLLSLIAPNDNALAQAQWAAEDLDLDDRIPEVWANSSASSEAAMYRALRAGDLDEGLIRAQAWHRQEPFASRPMVAASFFATIQGDFATASSLARIGLCAEPVNDALLNNLAFSLMCNGSIEEGVQQLRRARRAAGTAVNPQYIANVGLLSYLCGDPVLGSRAYENAIRQFERTGRTEEASLARVFHAFASQKTNDVNSAAIAKSASDSIAKGGTPLAKAVAVRFLNSTPPPAQTLIAEPVDAAARKWFYDQRNHLLILP